MKLASVGLLLTLFCVGTIVAGRKVQYPHNAQSVVSAHWMGVDRNGQAHNNQISHLNLVKQTPAHSVSNLVKRSSESNYVLDSRTIALSQQELQLNLTRPQFRTINHPLDSVNWTALKLSAGLQERVPAVTIPQPSNQQRPSYISNLEANNWVSKYYYKLQLSYLQNLNSSEYVRCPVSKPFFNKTNCVACDYNFYFDFDSNRCVSPKQGQSFNPNIHSFVSAKPGYRTDLNSPRLEFGGKSRAQIEVDLRSEARKPVCPKDKPFDDGILCIDCLEPYPLFRIEARRCVRCKDNEEYSAKNHFCYQKGGSRDIWTPAKSLSNIITNI